MTATADREAAASNELMPLAEYLGSVLRRLRALPPLDLDLTEAHGNVLAADVIAPHPFPAFDQAAIDGYAARWEDLAGAGRIGSHPSFGQFESTARSIRLNVVGDMGAAHWRPVRITPGTCFSVAAGAPLPIGADVVVPIHWTDQGMAAVEILHAPKRGSGVRRAGEEVAVGQVLAVAGSYVTPPTVALFAASGIGHVLVRPSPRVVVVATGDELVDVGRPSQPGQVVDANSHALTAAAVEAGAMGFRIGICDDDPEGLRGLLEDQTLRADLIITTGGTGTGPGDMLRRVLSRPGPGRGTVEFIDVALSPGTSLGFGTVGGEEVPVVCLPGEPGAALIGFEVLARPVIRLLAGAEPVFRPGIKAHLLETVSSPGGLREFRPAHVAERRGGGYTVQPLAGGPYTLSGLAEANGLLVLGERVTTAAAGSTVDVLLIDRRR
ncbi:molybdopterin molybdotransferase MoeA [Actinoplanes derwentensis]|uniref:Molybdopterin molybdenumtransferase n=1 Tax=Actinoplanes derwentensis TaxID=113562 RepID=A0A1H2D0D0_9ACTN|nr:gephyrin-like molybdotransferase Glp [Actinoplanes derwentensis]GID85871.1 molybdopterin molybdenumtransferase [Actinoplanes derwentensis]SDT76200.1 molybdopterin molybdochelatase [Actinoplanes derwentensis]